MTTATETELTPEQLEAKAEHDAIAAQLQEEYARLEADAMADTPEKQALFKYVRLRNRYAAELTRVKDQMAAMARSLESKLDGLDYMLKSVAENTARQLIAGGKSKSLKTPYGTVGFRTKPMGLNVVDDAAVILARAEGKLPDDVVKTKVEVSKSALNDHFKASGEVPPGCEVIEASETFYVK